MNYHKLQPISHLFLSKPNQITPPQVYFFDPQFEYATFFMFKPHIKVLLNVQPWTSHGIKVKTQLSLQVQAINYSLFSVISYFIHYNRASGLHSQFFCLFHSLTLLTSFSSSLSSKF